MYFVSSPLYFIGDWLRSFRIDQKSTNMFSSSLHQYKNKARAAKVAKKATQIKAAAAAAGKKADAKTDAAMVRRKVGRPPRSRVPHRRRRRPRRRWRR